MKVAFAIRPNYLEVRGGDTFQLLKTKEYLMRDWGCDVTVVTSPEDLQHDVYDLLHVFNLQTTDYTLRMVRAAKEDGIKVFLSPIMWHFGDARYVNRASRLTCNFNVISSLRCISKISEWLSIQEEYAQRKEILDKCDAILPNSVEEGEIVRSIFHSDVPVFVVPNCVDLSMKQSDIDISLPKNIILEVGRIEPTKNQLAVILALMDHKEIPLFFVGQQNPIKKHYIDYVKSLATKRGNTYFVEDVPQSDLITYYKAAKVHVLPSFRESPGLVTLEAMYYDTNVVVSSEHYCPISYYKLDKYGYVCDPFSIRSIEKEIMSAYKEEIRKVPDEYFSFIHYKNAAKLTHEAYTTFFQ